jgi:hypothetical protein
MKKGILVILLLTVFIFNANGSSFFYDEEVVNNGLNLFIGPKIVSDPANPSEKEYWFYSNISPEFTISMVTFGLDLRFQYNISDSKFYSDDWNSFEGILRKICFIKLGKKYSKYYFRFGDLKGTSITPGIFMANYSNSPIIDKEKRGFELGFDLGMGGFELMLNDLSHPSLLGTRAFFRPLFKTKIPVVSNTQVGISYVGDFKAPSNVQYEDIIITDDEGNTETVRAVIRDDNDDPVCDYKTVSTIAFDANAPITKFNVFTTGVYGSYGKFLDAGNGIMAGAYVYTIFDIKVNLEYRDVSPDFIVDYFDQSYEVDKWGIGDSEISKYKHLMYLKTQVDGNTSTGRIKGIFGGISGNLFNKILISGSYMDMEGPDNGILRINLDATRAIEKIKARFTYTKGAVNHPKDLFTIDDRSFIIGKIDYQMTKFLLLSIDYKRIYQYNEITGIYDAVESFIPNLQFNIDF